MLPVRDDKASLKITDAAGTRGGITRASTRIDWVFRDSRREARDANRARAGGGRGVGTPATPGMSQVRDLSGRVRLGARRAI